MERRTSKTRTVLPSVAFIASSLAPAATAGSLDQAAAMGRIAGRFEAVSHKVPPAVLSKLSSGVRNYVNLARHWKELGAALSGARLHGLESPTALPGGLSPFVPIAVSPPPRI